MGGLDEPSEARKSKDSMTSHSDPPQTCSVSACVNTSHLAVTVAVLRTWRTYMVLSVRQTQDHRGCVGDVGALV